ncbi:methyltransferase domain-containing protein [Nonomuraea sp. NPDC002799]
MTCADHRESAGRMVAGIAPAPQRTGAVLDALRSLPRHLFIPARGRAVIGAKQRVAWIDRQSDPAHWWDVVYQDSVIVTQVADGRREVTPEGTGSSSSASAPSTVADLLGWLNAEPGQRVLEVGTGTGYTAALLSHLVGRGGAVTSIEVDPAVAEQAAKNLAAADVHPHLVVGDGADGCPERAPYDRVHVTCGVRTIPYAWVEQCRPGGVIVLPWCPGLGNGHALRLVALPDGTAYGRFPGFAAYMMMRSQRPPDAAGDDGSGRDLRTRVDPRTIANAPPGALLAMAALTGLQVTSHVQDGLVQVWVADQDDPAVWSLVTHRSGQAEFDLYRLGDRPVWDEVTDAYFRWVSWGEPSRDRFGMTVTPEGQSIWLDSPDHVLTG